MAEEQKLEVEEPVVGWVVWKDEWKEMVVLGDEDGQPRLFTSYAAAKWERGSLDVVAPVTQRRYDELGGKKVAVEKSRQPLNDDADEDPQELWVRSVLAKLDEWNSKSSKRVVKSDPTPAKRAVRPDPAPPEQVVKLERMPPKRKANQSGSKMSLSRKEQA